MIREDPLHVCDAVFWNSHPTILHMVPHVTTIYECSQTAFGLISTSEREVIKPLLDPNLTLLWSVSRWEKDSYF